jgi:hypothetical protein
MVLQNILLHRFRSRDSRLNHLSFLEIRISPPSFEALQALDGSTL